MTHEIRGMPEDRNAMSFGQLVACAWRETPPVHKNATNLLIHLFAVPLFVIGHVLMVAPVHPFIGARDFLRRLYAEQFCNYWRFLFSGQWYASLKASRTRA